MHNHKLTTQVLKAISDKDETCIPILNTIFIDRTSGTDHY